MVEETKDSSWTLGVDSSDSDSFTVNYNVDTVATPAYTFTNDTDTGFYRINQAAWEEHQIRQKMYGLQDQYIKELLDRKALVQHFEECRIDHLSQVELLEQWDDFKEQLKNDPTLVPPEIKYQTTLNDEAETFSVGFATSVSKLPTP